MGNEAEFLKVVKVSVSYAEFCSIFECTKNRIQHNEFSACKTFQQSNGTQHYASTTACALQYVLTLQLKRFCEQMNRLPTAKDREGGNIVLLMNLEFVASFLVSLGKLDGWSGG